MPNYVEYQKSISAEFKAYENRVRNIIDDHHWGEDGHYKEIIVMNYLKRILPENVSVGTGFVKSSTDITKQIDIIIYDKTFPMLFSEGDFVIVIPESVLGIIEIKSCINSGKSLKKYIETANYNSNIICGEKDKAIFNGIFAFQCKIMCNKIIKCIEQLDYSEIIKKQNFNQVYSNRLNNCVNHLVYSSNLFMKLWVDEFESCYKLYEMPDDLAVGYFISNLQELVFKYVNGQFLQKLPDALDSFLYPLPKGKEEYCKKKIYIGE